MNSKEQKRLMVLNKVLQGQLTAREAGELLGLSVRQIRRMTAAYTKEGAAALAHGNRGRTPHNALSAQVRERIVELARTKYAGTNQLHMSELLAEREGIQVCHSTVRNMLLQRGITSCRKRRGPKHRSRRERYPQAGMLWQMDASPHDWLEGRGPRLVLLALIDDATGTVPAALFRKEEDARGYMLLMRKAVLRHGRPLAVYHDRHSIFVHTPRRMVDWSIEEQLRGEVEPTQFGRMLAELEINSIAARSPQAKGRVERLFGTLQSRLVTELRLAGASSEEEANCVLEEYLPRFDERFGVSAAAAEEGTAYRPLPEEYDIDTILCMKYARTVGADNTIRFFGQRLQILPAPDPKRMSYVRARVEVHERLDGELAVYYKRECLATQAAPMEAPVLRARSGPRALGVQTHTQAYAHNGNEEHRQGEGGLARPHPACAPHSPGRSKPSPNHPWRRYPNRLDIVQTMG